MVNKDFQLTYGTVYLNDLHTRTRVYNVIGLPDEVVSTNQLSRFKTHIKQINLNNFLIGKA